MSRRALTFCILTLLLVAYMVIMVGATNRSERDDLFSEIRISVNDSVGTGFITVSEVDEAIGYLTRQSDTLRRHNLDTYELTNRLKALDRVEDATVLLMNNGVLDIKVVPLVPVARIFDPTGSFYINAKGKKVPARASYHIDVPVITSSTEADSTTVAMMLPLLNRIKSDRAFDAFVSAIDINSSGDIIIIPTVMGHVINFGDSTDVDNKILRLRTFYSEVMPVKGWNAYDTISVKWSGRVTAVRSPGNRKTRPEIPTEEILDETAADEEMLAGQDATRIPPKN